MVGYGIDNALALLPDEPTQATTMLSSLRDEVTRVITELRLSLFELRSDVDPHGGLAAAIAEYARTMGAAGGMRVHLSLDEGGARLPAAVEGELLRIAQEAITNARKHARARNLWVSCEIDPPYVKLQVSDDGRGVGAEAREDSFGMSIMAERAQRIRARLEVDRANRPGQPSRQCSDPGREAVASRHRRRRRASMTTDENTVTTVLLVDDHELIRQGLRHAFERDPQFRVVGEAGSVAEALSQADETRPDVVIMDLRLPDGSGLDATRKLRSAMPAVGIVVLTMYAGDEQLFGALEAGASAFVPKNAPSDEVVAAARHAASAPTAFTASDLAEAMKRRLAPTGPQLSPREGQVLQLLADGMSVAGIAKHLYVSESTAKTHISKLYEKLGAGNRAQALMTALRLGLLEAPNAPRF
ncbi:helix-turn-helix transcriptional regulator [Fodinicola feengrottensis]|nr:response regulator transcription factor family protein [Fodinicola feengrottensis]